jgi:hypothetical protein
VALKESIVFAFSDKDNRKTGLPQLRDIVS